MDIRCRKTNCRYNDRLTCRSKEICIDNKINCKTYSFQEGKGIDISKKIFETPDPPKVAPYRHNKKISLICNAKCLFNQNGKCIANGITLCDNNKSARCITNAKP